MTAPLISVDPALLRQKNSALLLNLIWQERSISRAEIARRTGLSKATVAELTAELIGTELVRESGDGTRPSALLEFRDDAFVLVGVELARSYLQVVATDLRGCVRASRQRVHPVAEQPESTLRLLQKLIDSCLQDLKVPSTRVLGIGVAVPVPVDPDEPEVLHPRILPAWQDVNLAATLREAYGRPVYLENDANLGAIAERWWGAGVSGEDLAFVQIETGVGAGLILSGQLYRGKGGTAGEIGHTAIDPRGPRCNCGLSGCLFTMIGSQHLLARAEALLKEGRPSRLFRHGLSVAAIVDAAHVGDPVARQVIGEAGNYLGVAVASLLNLLSPSIVVLGGPLAAAGDLLLAPIRDTVRHRTLWKSVNDARIMTSMLGEAVIAVGAATRVLEHTLATPPLTADVKRSRKLRGESVAKMTFSGKTQSSQYRL